MAVKKKANVVATSKVQQATDKKAGKMELAKKKREEVLERVETSEKKLAPKRLKQVLENPLVKVELVDEKLPLPLDPVPMSAVAIEGLMEFAIHGTHLRLLAMTDPNAIPTLEQRVAIAKRLCEVGPFLPRYIKTVQLKKGQGLSVEEVEESEEQAKHDAESRAKTDAVNLGTPAEKTEKRAKREKAPKDSTPKETTSIPNGVPLKKICASLNVDPKLARRVLRAKGGKPGGRWEWPEAEVEAIKIVIADGVKELEKKGG